MSQPSRGEIWLADLNPTRGHEQAGRRPVLVVSDDIYNQGPSGLIVAIPISSRIRKIAIHVPVSPPEGGLRGESSILCDHIRSVSRERLTTQFGKISAKTLFAVDERLRILLAL